MKIRNIVTILPCLAILLTIPGCSKDKDNIFTATTQNYTAPKVHIANSNIAYWDNGDNVNINGNSYSISIDGSNNNNNNTARIAATNVSTYGGKYYAAFPASRASMSGSSVSFDVPYNESYATNASGQQLVNNIMVAKSDDNHLAFENVGAMLHFNIKGSSTGVGKQLLAIEVSCDKPLSGTLSVNMSGETISSSLSNSGDNNARILTFDSPYTLTETAKDFYLNIPEVSGATKFTVRYIFNYNKLKVFEKTKSSPSADISFQKGHIYNFGSDTYDGSQVSFNGSTVSQATAATADNPLHITSSAIFSAATDLLGTANKNLILDKDITVGTTVTTLKATLDGNGHTVTLSNNISLFQTIDGGTVRNLTIDGNISSPTCNSYRYGALACYASGAVIENCVNKANITCRQGYQNNNITVVGGLCARTDNCIISGCRNEGSITSDARYTGGISGHGNPSTTTDGCSNSNTITVSLATGENHDVWVGGLFGHLVVSSSSGTHSATNCHNSGSITISGTTSNNIFCGGCFGQITSGADFNVNDCYNTGTINYNNAASGSSYFGGIVGGNDNNGNATMLNCYNEGDISTNSGVIAGGLLGKNHRMSILNCYAFCNITAANAAGIVAIGPTMPISTQISFCYYYGTMSATTPNGIAGNATNSSIKMEIDHCYYPNTIANVCGNFNTTSNCSQISNPNDNTLLSLLTTGNTTGGHGWRLDSTHVVFQ